LQRYVIGEAKGAFANFDLTDANYDAAWDLLGRRYDNKRILINYYISRLLSIPSAKKETASELKFVVDNFKEVVYSLNNNNNNKLGLLVTVHFDL
jgi:hypothetical protein